MLMKTIKLIQIKPKKLIGFDLNLILNLNSTKSNHM